MAASFDTIQKVLYESREHLLKYANVVATGLGYKITQGEKRDSLCVICSVTNKTSASRLSPRDRVPSELDGVLTDVIETGPIRVFQSRTGRHRPAPGGVSIGHRNITAGTLGCLVKKNGDIVILSNNHVLANSNDAARGDAILQPGPVDGGRFPDDHIADLLDFVPIRFPDSPSGCSLAQAAVTLLNVLAAGVGSRTQLRAVTAQIEDNKVDAAIARPLNPADVSNDILEVGTVQGLASGELGLAVKKSGRTTGLTTGQITQVNVTVNVDYGAGRTARFTDQLMAGPMSQGGDSGSVVLNESNQLVGLLFAGSDNSTIINRIENVFSALGLSL